MENNIDLHTSSIEIISSLHGKQRRIERDINKKDLQAAIKYGLIEKQRNNRYKITYNNIIYITDDKGNYIIFCNTAAIRTCAL